MSIVPRKNLFSIAGLAAFGLVFSLVACDGSSSVNVEEEPLPIGSGNALKQEKPADTALYKNEPDSAYCDSLIRKEVPYTCGDSLGIDGVYYRETGFLRQEAAGCTYKCEHNKWSFVPAKDIPDTAEIVSDELLFKHPSRVRMLLSKKCNAENEGLIESLATNTTGNPKGGTGYDYYRCEQGNWVERPAWVKCDTAGVTEGALCRLQTYFRGIQFGEDTWKCYKYAGSGSWNDADCPTEPEKECNEENKDAKEKLAFTNDTLFYKCSGTKWIETGLTEYNCSTGTETFGDTCSFEISGEKKYFRYDRNSEGYGRWIEAAFDPELGFCTLNSHDSWDREYGQKGDDYYYCSYLNGTTWLQTDLVPRQYTDPRKEGLTDEEYDVLDLPKDATVGALVGGLLEECVHDRTFNYFETNGMEDNETYDYCKPIHYYRYGDDGSWKEEIIYKSMGFYFDKPNNEICGEDEMCCAETEGAKYLYSAESTGPELIYQCVSGESVFVEYAGRYEKKSK